MPIATAPALLIGLGARIVLDFFSRTDGPFVKDFILAGAWQGVALHYVAKTSKTSGFGIIVALAIVAKLFIEFNLASDSTKCISTILGVALGVLFTDFLSQYFDKPPPVTDRRRKKTQATKRERKAEKTVQFRPSVRGGSVETLVDITDVTDLGTLATTSQLFSDITSVDSNSDKIGPTSSMSAADREIYVLRTRASLADSERRRFKEERKWAISQGNIARASQMKWEVKRYTALMETFTREADTKAAQGELDIFPQAQQRFNPPFPTTVAGIIESRARHGVPDDKKSLPSGTKEKAMRSSRDVPSNGRISQKPAHHKRSSNAKLTARDANG